MIEYSLSEQIAQNMPSELTLSQASAIDCFCAFLADPDPYAVFVLSGYAGTGKTAWISAVVKALSLPDISICLMAPTGRAAKVLRERSGRDAHTIHRVIYRSVAAMPEEGGTFSLAKGGRSGSLYIVDEASMIGRGGDDIGLFGSGDLLADLLAYVAGTDEAKLVFVGDTAQLPPVGSVSSPALDTRYLSEHYGLNVYTASLTEVLRQSLFSGILVNATRLRNTISSDGEIRLDGSYADIHLISGADLIESLDAAYRRYGRENVLVVCYSNKRALAYNLGIRSQVLDYEDEIVRGDRLVVVRNNYAYARSRDKSDFIANGEIVEVRHIGRSSEIYGKRFAEVDVYLEDRDSEERVTLLKDSLATESAHMNCAERESFYQNVLADYTDEPSVVKRREAVRSNPYWQALEVKYAYALTCHKAQGGQWPCVFIDMGLFAAVKSDEQLIRWLYTALTRASAEVYLINTPATMLDQQAD